MPLSYAAWSSATPDQPPGAAIRARTLQRKIRTMAYRDRYRFRGRDRLQQPTGPAEPLKADAPGHPWCRLGPHRPLPPSSGLRLRRDRASRRGRGHGSLCLPFPDVQPAAVTGVTTPPRTAPAGSRPPVLGQDDAGAEANTRTVPACERANP